MSLKGYRCPPGTPTAGNTNTIEHCLHTCPHKCVSPPLLAAMWKSSQEDYHVGTYISASMLAGGGCARQTVFERNEPFYSEPRKRYWPFRGTHAHSIIEGASELIRKYGWLQELRMKVDFEYPEYPAPIFENNKFTGDYDTEKSLIISVGGTTDSYNVLTKELWDMKTCADAKADMMIRATKPGTLSPHLEDSWVKQVNIYRYLLAHTKIPDNIKKEFKLKAKYYPAPEKLGIQAISMMEIPVTGSAYQARNYKVYNIENVPVWTLEEIEQFIRPAALQWYKWLALKELPPVVPEDKKWLCSGCAFNGEVYADGICFPKAERKAASELIELVEDL